VHSNRKSYQVVRCSLPSISPHIGIPTPLIHLDKAKLCQHTAIIWQAVLLDHLRNKTSVSSLCQPRLLIKLLYMSTSSSVSRRPLARHQSRRFFSGALPLPCCSLVLFFQR